MPVTAKPSLRYELICDNSVRKMPDGREICCDTPKGRAEYKRRTAEMALRQHNVCGLGSHLLRQTTFEHLAGRGSGGAHQDDRIVDDEGKPMNCAACADCNFRKGSKRL